VEFSCNDLEIVSTSTLQEVNSDVPNDTVCDWKKMAQKSGVHFANG